MDIYQIWTTYNRQWSRYEILAFAGVLILVCTAMAVCVHRKKLSIIQAVAVLALVVFLGIVFGSTVFTRTGTIRQYELVPFWSWRDIIRYPVMYRPGDKNYYLHRDFNGDYSANGCLFLAEECVPGDSDNLIIYGHHMNSGKMFADLEKYKDKGFYEEHPTILFRTIWGNEQYQILSAFTTPVYTGNDFNYYSFIKAQKGADYEYFIREIKRKAIYETGITAEYGDKLLTLSTCEYSQQNGRMVVVAKKIQQNES